MRVPSLPRSAVRGARKLFVRGTPAHGRALKVARIARRPITAVRRRGLARSVPASRASLIESVARLGYAKTNAEILGIDGSLLLELSMLVPSPVEVESALAHRSGASKPYWINITEERPELLASEGSPCIRTALAEPLLETAAAYLGSAPRLFAAQLMYTPPQKEEMFEAATGRQRLETLKGSQLWHFDYGDSRILKAFVYPRLVGSQNGPTSILPREESKRFLDRYGGRFSDDDLVRMKVLNAEVPCVGEAGCVYLVDTAACLHMGSRSRAERLVLILDYRTAFAYEHPPETFAPLTAGPDLSRLQRAALTPD